MASSGTASNNNEISEEDDTSNNKEITEEATINNNDDIKEDMYSTSDNNHISEDDVTLFVAYDGEWEYDSKEWSFENSKSSIMVVPKRITLSEITGILNKQFKVNAELYELKLEVHYRTTGSPWFPVTEIQNNKDLSVFISETSKTRLPLCVSRSLDWYAYSYGKRSKDRVTVFVAYNEEWEEYHVRELFFENSKSSTIFVPKHITLSEITDIIYEHLYVDKKLDRLKLTAARGDISCRWFDKIENDHDLSMFISETSKTKLPLCVSRLLAWPHEYHVGERKKDPVTVFVAYNGKWEYDGKEWFFKDSRGSQLVVSKHIKLSEITHILSNEFVVLTQFYRLKLEVHYRTGSPWFPVTEIRNDQDLSVFISETSKTKLPLCVTLLKNYVPDVDEEKRKDNKVERRLMKAIRKNDWVKAREIVNTKEVTWTSKLDDHGYTAFHFAVGEFKDNEVVTDIVSALRSNLELLETTVNNDGMNPVQVAALYGNTEALKIMFDSNPKCLFIPNNGGYFAINFAFVTSTIETFQYLFNQMKSYKDEFDKVLIGESGLWLLAQVIDKGLIDVAYELIQDYPSMATQVYHDITPLERIIRKPDLFYSGTHYNILGSTDTADIENNSLGGTDSTADIENNSLGGTNTAVVENQETPKRRCLHDGCSSTMQRELQWFEEVKKLVGITKTQELNKNKETPIMVFRKEHKELRKDGEEWMKKTADSYTITAALIITIVFAAAITVPGGNDSATGKPIYQTKSSLIIFAISDAISLFTSTTSLLLFLSILTARYADEDFLYKLPKRLIFGLVMLFVSVTSMMITFSAALYIMFGQGKPWILIPIAALACLPIASFVTLQFPLLVELISSTYGPGIFTKEKEYRQSSANANKKKKA
ncbi:ankyrin repeat family protein [Tanacetum coccineum]|uniref:Ankyrin repeat family protein n=1 Tax=Tanacetum coccineum TaxID=301880 RepID=A0ABQ5D945_9ASTR